ncbi:hypothetical protein MRX96_010460 [Rhipicephalus microplus]
MGWEHLRGGCITVILDVKLASADESIFTFNTYDSVTLCLSRNELRFGTNTQPSSQRHIRAGSPAKGMRSFMKLHASPRAAAMVTHAPREDRDAPVESICVCVGQGAYTPLSRAAQLALGTFFTRSPKLARWLAAVASSRCRFRPRSDEQPRSLAAPWRILSRGAPAPLVLLSWS